MADATLGRIPVYNSWAVQPGQVVIFEGPTLWAHPRTVARLAHPDDPIAQLRAILAVLVADAQRALAELVAAQMIEAPSGPSDSTCRGLV